MKITLTRSLIGVPTLYRMMLEHDRLDQYDLSSLKYCFSGGDVLPVEVGKRWQEKFGIPIYQGYGATETCGGVSMCPVDIDTPPKSVGRILATKQIKIVDPATLEPVGVGDPGEPGRGQHEGQGDRAPEQGGAGLDLRDEEVVVAETSTLPYAVRLFEPGKIRIFNKLKGGLFSNSVRRSGYQYGFIVHFILVLNPCQVCSFNMLS